MTPSREKLHTAIGKHQDAVTAAEKASETLARAKEFVGELETQASAFKALDKEIAESRAASIKQAVAAGQKPTIEASPELIADLVKKHEAENQLGAAMSAVASLEEEAADINQRVARLDLEREFAAAEVLSSEAEGLARAFATELEELRGRYFILSAMTTRRVRVDPKMIPANLPSYMITPTTHIEFSAEVSNIVARGSVIGGYEVNSRECQIHDRSESAVQDLFTRLKSDASATIEDSLL